VPKMEHAISNILSRKEVYIKVLKRERVKHSLLNGFFREMHNALQELILTYKDFPDEKFSYEIILYFFKESRCEDMTRMGAPSKHISIRRPSHLPPLLDGYQYSFTSRLATSYNVFFFTNKHKHTYKLRH
jgi:hypothetical protein